MVDTLENEPKIYVKFILLSIFLWLIFLVLVVGLFYLFNMIQSDSSSYSQDFLHYIEPYIHINFRPDSIPHLDHMLGFGWLTLFTYFAISATEHISNIKIIELYHPNFIKSRIMVHSIITFWIAFVFAVAIEYAQFFLPDRQGSVIEVLASLVGIIVVLAGIRIVFLMVQLIRFLMKKYKNDDV